MDNGKMKVTDDAQLNDAIADYIENKEKQTSDVKRISGENREIIERIDKTIITEDGKRLLI